MAQKCIHIFQTIEKLLTCRKLALHSTNEEEYFMKMNINPRHPPAIGGVTVLAVTLTVQCFIH